MVRGMAFLDAIQCVIILALVTLISNATSDDTVQIPASKSDLNTWFQANVKPYASRKGTLDKTLEAAEANPKIIKVRKNGRGHFTTVTDAVKSIPLNNKQRVIVDIGPGVYTEKITIDREKPFVTFYGSPKGMPTLAFGATAKQYGTDDSATLIVMSEFFVAANIIIKNTAPRPNGRPQAQAVALRLWGNKAAIYNCKILGFQDTLCDDQGMHFFKDCYIEGTIDFIFGGGKSIYLNSILHVVEDKLLTVITAQARTTPLEDTGFVFIHCSVTGDGTGAFLGRAWMEMPRVVFAYTRMGKIVNLAGWFNNFHPERERTVSFGEYRNTGPGFKPNKRVKYSKQLTDVEVKGYLSLGYIKGSTWLLPPPSLWKKFLF